MQGRRGSRLPTGAGNGASRHRRDGSSDHDHQLLRPGRRGHRVRRGGLRLRQDRPLHPGTRIPIVDEQRLFEEQRPAILFSWHLADIIGPKLRERGYTGEICHRFDPADRHERPLRG